VISGLGWATSVMAELQSAVPPASHHYLYLITSPRWWTHLNTYTNTVRCRFM
jgi:hypothetical protein